MKEVLGFRAEPEIVEAIKQLAAAESVTVSEALLAVILEGLRARMFGDAVNPVDPAFLERLDDEGVAVWFTRFLAAKRHKAGWHFEKPPTGGYWSMTGQTGWRIVQRGGHLTPDGICYTKGAKP